LHTQYNTPKEQLMELVKPGEILGRVTAKAAGETGLPEGLPVVATAHDKAVEALGTGTLNSGTVLISLGTYIGAMTQGCENRKDAQDFWVFQDSIPHNYLYECMGVRRGMWTISWACDEFGGAVREAAENKDLPIEVLFEKEAERVPAGCDGLLTIHDFAPPPSEIYRKGVMIGFDGRHTRAHIYRSILEGIAFTMKTHVDKMMDELGTPLEQLVLSGGGSKSDLFTQIFADVFGVPTVRTQVNDAAAVGCAINAGMAVGAFGTYAEATQKMVKTGEITRPIEANLALYASLHEVYKQAQPHFDAVLKKLSPLVD